MTEIDYLKLKLEDKEKAFDKLHKRHMDCLKKQGELERELKELEEENEQLRKELDNFKPIMFQNMQKGTIILYFKGGIDERE